MPILGQNVENIAFETNLLKVVFFVLNCGKRWFWVKTVENANYGLKFSIVSILGQTCENVNFWLKWWKMLSSGWNRGKS